jgi:hypothetical protein
MFGENIYKPQGVLLLVQLCAQIIKENEDLFKDEIPTIPLTLQNYIHNVKQGFIYVFDVTKPRKSMDVYEKRNYKTIKGKKVVQCSLCFNYCYCEIFLKNKKSKVMKCFKFPDSVPINYRCFCCSRNAIVIIQS